MQVNVARNGANLGVFELETLKSMASQGQLLVSDHVYLANESRWEQIERIPELRSALFPARAVPPPPPPPPAPAQQVIPPPPPPTGAEAGASIREPEFTSQFPSGGSSASPTPAVTETDPDERLLKEKLGSNADRYVRKYRANKGKQVFVSWNWAAFFIGPFWSAYRSLWPVAIGFAVIVVACTYGYGQFSLPRILFNGIPLLVAVVLGLIGDSMVIQSVLKKGREGAVHQNGKQKLIGGAFGLVTLVLVAGIGMWSTCWSCSDEKFAEYAMSRLIDGWDGASDLIDWQNLQMNGQDIGSQYNAMPNAFEAKNFEFAFIGGFSKEVKKRNFELHLFRLVGSQGPVRIVHAKGNGREFEIHVIQTEDGKKIQAFNPVLNSN